MRPVSHRREPPRDPAGCESVGFEFAAELEHVVPVFDMHVVGGVIGIAVSGDLRAVDGAGHFLLKAALDDSVAVAGAPSPLHPVALVVLIAHAESPFVLELWPMICCRCDSSNSNLGAKPQQPLVASSAYG